MRRIIYLVLGVTLLMLGLVGLLFPLLPGVLFLALAAVLLSRASRRVARFLHSRPELRGFNETVARMESLPVADRIRVTALMGCRTMLDGINAVSSGIRRGYGWLVSGEAR